MMTKVLQMASFIDDTFDAYGIFDELVSFTDAIQRWDTNAIDSVPPYLRHAYQVLLGIYDEMEQVLAKECKLDRVYYAKYEMKKLVRAYFKEAQWLNADYTPRYEEHMENALATSAYLMASITCLVGIEKFISRETFEWLKNDPLIVRAASLISKAMDDVVGYEKEITNGWKDINKEFLRPTEVPMFVLERVLNFARVMDMSYKNEDGYTNSKAPPSSILGLSNTNDPNSAQAQTGDPFYAYGFSPYANVSGVAGTSTMSPPNPSITNNPLFTLVTPATVSPQLIVQKNIGEPSHDQLYPSEMTFKPPNPHYHAHQHDSPILIKSIVKSEEHKEMAREVRSLEQSMRNMQGLGGPKSVSYKYLCMFPDVYFLLGFKIPKFEKYEWHGDPVAYLRCYCNQLRGVGGKEQLLMAYLGERLSILGSEWFVDQDIDKWSSWDDLANEFVQQFQYNVELIPDEKFQTNIKKKNNENFREYAIRWREQAVRVKPPMKESKMVEVFIQA
ncbi:putative nitrate transporter 1.4-like [Capsicum annuum]|nr:putative nitrate transporter 1.4-like [Capsicum annuum]